MWEHQAGGIDFEEQLLLLFQRGWEFQESVPVIGDANSGSWTVTGVRGGERVRANNFDQRDAWAEAVRIALMTPIERESLLAPPLSESMGGFPNDPTVCDEARDRLRTAGWSFSEHPTAQASGLEGWVISGTLGDKRIRVVEDDRSDAWGQALILATVLGSVSSRVHPETPPANGAE